MALRAGAAAMKRRKAGGQRAEGEQEAAKKKRKRKQRLPKGFDPENPGPVPDPERWLPKWQRSDAKRRRGQRRRDKVREVFMLHAGFVANEPHGSTRQCMTEPGLLPGLETCQVFADVWNIVMHCRGVHRTL